MAEAVPVEHSWREKAVLQRQHRVSGQYRCFEEVAGVVVVLLLLRQSRMWSWYPPLVEEAAYQRVHRCWSATEERGRW